MGIEIDLTKRYIMTLQEKIDLLSRHGYKFYKTKDLRMISEYKNGKWAFNTIEEMPNSIDCYQLVTKDNKSEPLSKFTFEELVNACLKTEKIDSNE